MTPTPKLPPWWARYVMRRRESVMEGIARVTTRKTMARNPFVSFPFEDRSVDDVHVRVIVAAVELRTGKVKEPSIYHRMARTPLKFVPVDEDFDA